MPISFVGVGGGTTGIIGSTGAIPVAYPTSLYIGDLLMLFVESGNQAIATPSGWTAVGTQVGTGGSASAGGVRLGVFYRFATQTDVSTTTNVTVADTGDHQSGVMVAFRGVNTSTPFNVTSAYTAGSGTAMTWPSVTTTVADAWIVNACALDFDGSSSGRVSSPINNNLTSVTERFDATHSQGFGGGVCVITGVKTVIGATGSTSATQASALNYDTITIALNPATTDTVQPTILSSATVSVWETVALSHALTASETVTWSIVGGLDAAKFSISGSTLTMPSQSYANPTDSNGDRIYNVIVRATDGAGLTTDQTINVTVLDIDEPTMPASGTVVLTNVGPGRLTVPSGVTQFDIVECWGGGGGAIGAGGNQAGGGGGAYSAISSLEVTPGQTIYYNVAAGGLGDNSGVSVTYSEGGDSWFGATTYAAASVAAQGARNTNSSFFNAQGGGQASAGIGTVKYSGGSGTGGGAASDASGITTKGMGGASASPSGNGETITNSSTRGGNSPGAGAGGANATSANPAGQNGTSNENGGGGGGAASAATFGASSVGGIAGAPGGGSGGGNTPTASLNGPNGARGQIRITYTSGGTPPEPARRAPRSSHVQ